MPDRAVPPVWDVETLSTDRLTAIADFVAQRNAEGGSQYRAAVAKSVTDVEALFSFTDDLRTFGTGVALASHPSLSGIARYLCGPPVSGDDLDTIAGAKLAGRSRLSIEDAQRIEGVILVAIDRDRFPWVGRTAREPSAIEREVGVRWTAGLKAAQEVATGRRGISSKRQQEAVRKMLRGIGNPTFNGVRRRNINSIRDLAPGEYVESECSVRGSNCDVAIAAHDGRLVLVEAKVSNSGVNSYKRLIHECGQKATHWRQEFGNEAITVAVLSGVFELKNLTTAQLRGAPIVLFWEHHLDAFGDFLRAAT